MKYRRIQIIAEEKVQSASVRRSLGHLVLLTLAGSCISLALQLVTMRGLSIGEHIVQLGVRVAPFWLGLLVLAPLFMLDMYRFTNRIAGPIFKLKSVIRQLLQGEDVEMRIRAGDAWQELPPMFNALIQQLRKASPQAPSVVIRAAGESVDSESQSWTLPQESVPDDIPSAEF